MGHVHFGAPAFIIQLFQSTLYCSTVIYSERSSSITIKFRREAAIQSITS